MIQNPHHSVVAFLVKRLSLPANMRRISLESTNMQFCLNINIHDPGGGVA